MGDLGLIPGPGRYLGRRHGSLLQYSCLENPHGQRSLVGYSPWGHRESDTTERPTFLPSFLEEEWELVLLWHHAHVQYFRKGVLTWSEL